MAVTVLFEDAWFIAVDKPGGTVVHWIRGAPPGTPLLQQVRDQSGVKVSPVHRLDRGTSGVCLFAKTSEAASAAGKLFMTREVRKTYLALVRGWVDPEGVIDHPLSTGENNPSLKEAQTSFRCLQQVTLEAPIGRYPSARYSLVEVVPHTGRWRQIRRHFSHLRHPVIGDVKHGDRDHNRYFREQWGIPVLCLSAVSLAFRHPFTGALLDIQAQPGLALQTACDRLGIFLSPTPRPAENP